MRPEASCPTQIVKEILWIGNRRSTDRESSPTYGSARSSSRWTTCVHTRKPPRSSPARGTARALCAAQQAMEGSGSPLESKAAIMLFTERSIGGEQLTDVKLNHTIALTEKAQALAHQKTCVADALDSQHELVFEANGETYHADRHGFTEQSGRRAALETIGYTVMDITNDMINDLERFDAFLTSIEMQTGIHLRDKSVAFLGRREKLHGELFSPHTLRAGKYP